MLQRPIILAVGVVFSSWQPERTVTAQSEAAPRPNALTDAEKRQGWWLLFNGRDLTGWKVYQGPAWSVRDAAITSPGRGSGWLGTVATFDDFHLKMQFKIDKGNSGIFFRAATSGAPWVQGYESQINNKDNKNPTGSLYNRVRANVVNPAYGEWHDWQVKAVRDHIEISIDGQPVVDAYDSSCRSGVIGLQQHDPAVTIQFRDIKIRRLADQAERAWEPIFNGKDLAGWKPYGRAQWTVKDGVLIGRGGMGHLFTIRSFDDFEARAMIRVNKGGNGGFYFRTQPRGNDWPQGLEAQVDNHDPNNPTGSIYGRVKVQELLTADEYWFSMYVRALGDDIEVRVNGRTVVQARIDQPRTGHIALQCHDPGCAIEYRDVRVRRLSGKAGG